jgi:hypothetical protein
MEVGTIYTVAYLRPVKLIKAAIEKRGRDFNQRLDTTSRLRGCASIVDCRHKALRLQS